MKQDRLLLESQVVAVVDKHTNSYNRLDNDITCILEEVPEVVIDNSKEAMNKNYDNFQHIRGVLDKYNTYDKRYNEEFIEELTLALFTDIEISSNLFSLNEWLYIISSIDVPRNVRNTMKKYLEEKYK